MTKQEAFKFLLQKRDNPDSFFPPPAVRHMELEFLEYQEGDFLSHKAIIKEDYNNPGGVMFGGYYGMFFDAAFGPFSFIETQKYAASLDMNMTYLKSIKPKDEYVITTAKLISSSKTFLLMHGEMRKPDGLLAATATTRMMILNNHQIGGS